MCIIKIIFVIAFILIVFLVMYLFIGKEFLDWYKESEKPKFWVEKVTYGDGESLFLVRERFIAYPIGRYNTSQEAFERIEREMNDIKKSTVISREVVLKEAEK